MGGDGTANPDPGLAGSPAPTRERWQAVRDSLIDPFVIMQAVRGDDGRIVDFVYTDANQAAADYNGMPLDSWVGTRLLETFPGHLDSGMFDRYASVVETGGPLDLHDWEYPHELIGERRRYDVRATRLGDGIALSWRDTTAQYAHEQALTESERNYRLLAEHTADVVARSTVDGRLQWISPSVEGLLGWSPGDLIGRPIVDLVHRDDTQVFVDATAAVREGSTAHYRLRYATKDGAYRWVDVTVAPVTDASGTVVERIAALRDVEEEMTLRRSLTSSEHLWRVSVESTGAGLLTVALDGTFIDADPAASRMLGRAASWFPGRPVAELSSPEGPDPGLVDPAVLIGRSDVASDDLHLLRPDGSTVWLRRVALLVRDVQGRPDHVLLHLSDITGERQATAERDAAEARFRMLAESTSDVVWVHTPDGVVEWVSPSVRRVLGYEPEDLCGSQTELVVPEDRPLALAAVRSAVEAHRPTVRMQVRVATADGTVRWVDSLLDLVWREDGTLDRILTSMRDVTAEHDASDRLDALDRDFRLMAENATDVVYLADLDGVIRWVSPSVRDVMGVPAAHVLGHRFTEFVGAGDQPKLIAAAAAVPSRGRTHSEVRLSTGEADGRWVEVTIGPALDEAGAVVGQIGAVRDIDPEHRARDDLRAAEAQYRLMAENATDVVYQTALDGTTLWVSEGIERLLGLTPEEVVGTNGFDLTAPEDREVVAAAMAEAEQGRPLTVRMRVLTKDGGRRWIEATVHPVTDHNGDVTGYVGGWRDVQAEQEAGEQIRASRAMLEQAVRLAPVAMALVSPDGRVLLANHALSRLLGRSEEELQSGSTWQDVTHADDLPSSQQLVRELLDGRRQSFVQRKRYLRPDGTVVTADVWAYGVRDADGTPLFQIVQILPVTGADPGSPA